MKVFDQISNTIKEAILNIKNNKPKKPKAPLAVAKPIDRKDWPKFMQDEAKVKEVYVGGCKYTKQWDPAKMGVAHAHCGKGVICFMDEKRWNTRLIRLHETAHITANRGHTLNWAREFVRLDNGVNKWLTIDWIRKKYKFKTKKKTKSV